MREKQLAVRWRESELRIFNSPGFPLDKASFDLAVPPPPMTAGSRSRWPRALLASLPIASDDLFLSDWPVSCLLSPVLTLPPP